MYSRYEIMLENYTKVLNIESLTMLDMAHKRIIPAVADYIKDLTQAIAAKACRFRLDSLPDRGLICCRRLSELLDQLSLKTTELETVSAEATAEDSLTLAEYYRRQRAARHASAARCGRSAGASGQQKILAVPDLRRSAVQCKLISVF